MASHVPPISSPRSSSVSSVVDDDTSCVPWLARSSNELERGDASGSSKAGSCEIVGMVGRKRGFCGGRLLPMSDAWPPLGSDDEHLGCETCKLARDGGSNEEGGRGGAGVVEEPTLRSAYALSSPASIEQVGDWKARFW